MIALVVTVPASEAELAADALWSLGVLAVEERPADGPNDTGTTDQFVDLWTSLGDDHEEIARAAEGFPARWRWRTHEVDESLLDSWRAHAVPTWITPDLVVVPAWLDVDVPDGVTALRIEPGAAFGLDHPTTVVTLRALRGLIWPDATVLDVGCGSGVLAVGAAVLGAPYVEAVDVSAAAVSATLDNARRNGVESRLQVSTRALSELDEPHDVVVANILAPALIDLAGDLRRLTRPAGVLVVSGLLEGRAAHVIEALAPMQVVDELVRDGWCAIVLRH